MENKVAILEPLGLTEEKLKSIIDEYNIDANFVYYSDKPQNKQQLIERCQGCKAIVLAQIPIDREVIEIFAAKYGYLDTLKDVDVKPFLNDLYSYISKFNKNIINEINKTHILSDELEAEMKKVIESYIEEKKVLN